MCLFSGNEPVYCIPSQHSVIRFTFSSSMVHHSVVWLVIGANSFRVALVLYRHALSPVQFNAFGQFTQGFSLVLALGPVLSALGTDACLNMRNPDTRLCLVLVLAPRTPGGECVNSKVLSSVTCK